MAATRGTLIRQIDAMTEAELVELLQIVSQRLRDERKPVAHPRHVLDIPRMAGVGRSGEDIDRQVREERDSWSIR